MLGGAVSRPPYAAVCVVSIRGVCRFAVRENMAESDGREARSGSVASFGELHA